MALREIERRKVRAQSGCAPQRTRAVSARGRRCRTQGLAGKVRRDQHSAVGEAEERVEEEARRLIFMLGALACLPAWFNKKAPARIPALFDGFRYFSIQ